MSLIFADCRPKTSRAIGLVPPNTDPIDQVGLALQAALVIQGAPNLDNWESLLSLKPMVYYLVTDLGTGKQYKLYVGDEITVVYSGGSTEKWKFWGPDAGEAMWTQVPGSRRNKDGSDPSKPKNTSQSATGAAFNFTFSVPTTILDITGLPQLDDSLPRGQITVEELPGTSVTVTTEFTSQGWFGDCDCAAPDQ